MAAAVRFGVYFVAALAAAGAVQGAAADEVVLLADGDTSAWTYQTFDDIPPTAYTREAQAAGGAVLVAASSGGASGWTMERELSLYDTPWLHFRWRVDEAAPNPGEKTRAGDDFAWRWYFVGKSGLEYRVLNVVFSQTEAAGTSWKSPYAGWLRDIRTHAAAGGAADGQWHETRLNVGELWREMFGDDGQIGLVGLMTDADNAGGAMRAAYGDAVLTAE